MKGKAKGRGRQPEARRRPVDSEFGEGLAERDSPTVGEPATKAPVMCFPLGPKIITNNNLC